MGTHKVCILLLAIVGLAMLAVGFVVGRRCAEKKR